MLDKTKRLARRVAIGTPLEAPLRSFWHRLRAKPELISGDDLMTIRVMQRIVAKKSNCVDVGAHAGFFLERMGNLAPDGLHFAFEPIPWLFESLCKKFDDRDRFRVYPFALCDESGMIRFHYNTDNPAYSSLVREKGPDAQDRVVALDVEARRLDDIVPDLEVTFIKIDVEGAELPVLRGSSGILGRWHPVIILEFPAPSERFGSTEALHDFFSDHDYEIYALKRLFSGDAPLDAKGLIEEREVRRTNYLAAVPRTGALREKLLQSNGQAHA